MSGGDDSFGKLKTVTRLVPYRIKRIGSTESEESPPPTPKDVVKKERSCKDEKAAKDLKIPYTIEYIINCGMDDFGDILNDKTLNEEQLSLCREIRKRGKNKVNFDWQNYLNLSFYFPDCSEELSQEERWTDSRVGGGDRDHQTTETVSDLRSWPASQHSPGVEQQASVSRGQTVGHDAWSRGDLVKTSDPRRPGHGDQMCLVISVISKLMPYIATTFMNLKTICTYIYANHKPTYLNTRRTVSCAPSEKYLSLSWQNIWLHVAVYRVEMY